MRYRQDSPFKIHDKKQITQESLLMDDTLWQHILEVETNTEHLTVYIYSSLYAYEITWNPFKAFYKKNINK